MGYRLQDIDKLLVKYHGRLVGTLMMSPDSYSSGYRRGAHIKLFGTTHPLFNDSRVPNPLETVPTEFICSL